MDGDVTARPISLAGSAGEGIDSVSQQGDGDPSRGTGEEGDRGAEADTSVGVISDNERREEEFDALEREKEKA